MTKKLIETKNVFLQFIKNNKIFSMAVVLGIALLVVPLIFNKINAADEEINLELKDPTKVNSEENPYIIDSVDDFIILQEFSKTNDCYGMYFAVGDTLKNNRLTYNPDAEDEEDEEGSEADGITYNMNLVGTIILEDGLSKAEFVGIGQNVAKPFRGNILFNGITIRLDTPLFCFVGSGASIEEVHLFGDVNSDKFNTVVTKNAPVGMLVGMAILDSTELSLDISNISVSHNSTILGNTKSVGGIIGMVYANPYNKTINYGTNTTINVNNDRFEINLDKVTIPDAADFYSVGYSYINHTYGNGTLDNKGMLSDNTPGYTGGIIGDVTGFGYNYYVDVNFTGTTLVIGDLDNDKSGTGGVIGHIGGRVCVKFDGDIDVSALNKVESSSTTNYRGSVIGAMSKYAVAYMTEGHSISAPINPDLASLNEVEADNYNAGGQGTAGSIYKETPESFWSQNIEISGKGTADDPYILADVEDVERLSALLSSAGRFGTWYNATTKNFESWFEISEDPTPTNVMSITDILNYVRCAYFQIENDIDLSARNVVRLNRSSETSFAGSIIGKQGSYKDGNEYPTFTLNVTEYQAYVALIPYAIGRTTVTEDGKIVTTPCEYKNFNMEGTVEGRENVYGLIYSLSQSDAACSDYVFQNINMNLDISQKNSNGGNMSGFIGAANYVNVKGNLKEGLKLIFEDVNYNGDLITNSNGSSHGGVLAGTITLPGNDMNNTEDINNFEITIDGYDFSGTIKSTSTNGLRVGALIYTIQRSNNSGYVAYNIEGRSVSFGKNAIVNITNVNIHDAAIINGDGQGEVGGTLGYSWSWADVELNNVTLKDFTFDTNKGCGAVLFTNVSAIMDMDGLVYDNVSVIRSGQGNSGQWNSTLIWNNYGTVTIKDYVVNNSKILLYAARAFISENAINLVSNDSTRRVETYGTISYEGNNTNGEPYSAINSYESPWIYTDISTQTANYKNSSRVGTQIWYNLFSNMNGKTISGTGTMEDPFVIDSEEEMVLMSQIFRRHSMSKSECYDYFPDLEGMFTADELSTMVFTQKRALMTERVLTGVYVFAKDMDLSAYSFYPINNATGKYYGFDAYEYSGKDVLTDEELKEYCATAISVLNSESTVSGMTLESVNNNKPEIHFGADKIADTDRDGVGVMGSAATSGNAWNSPCSGYGIHVDMQSGLFCAITGSGTYTNGFVRGSDVTINNIELSGVIGCDNINTTTGGGAFLITGGTNYSAVYGATIDIKNIDFQEAFITQRNATGSNYSYASGLLIDTINNGDINITGVRILKDETGSANIRADALIGYQCGTSSKVIFRDIDLNAVIDQGTLSIDESTGEVSISTSEKEGSWRSDNTGVSGKDSVTGKFLDPYDEYGYGFKYGYYYFYLYEGAGIYYYDVGTDVVTPGRTDSAGLQTIQNRILLNSVQKYAYKTINVDVNPVSTNITQGSGTETDPYIINNVGQLLTLANFIKYEGEIIDYESWWVGDTAGTGYDEYDTDTWADDANILYKYRYISEDEDYRTQAVRHLTTSYYKITADIDFTDPNSPFADMATNFNGIGTSTYPFSGGFLGEVKADGSNPIIYVGNSVDSYQKTFGLIRYGKGFQVSNLDFENGYQYIEHIDGETGEYSYTKTDEKNKILISLTDTNVGMVASYIIGGDNIIDNVEINVLVQLDNNGTATCNIGGYVGYMTKGTLKVSGMNVETFDDFRIVVGNSMKNPTFSSTSNIYVSALVGRVDTGYILYDSDGALSSDIISIETDRETTTDSNGVCYVPEMNYYNEYGIGLCNTYDPINQSYLDSIDRIKIVNNDGRATNGMLIAEINDADQLFLYSLALGSGALSSSTAGPYNDLSSCKKDEEEWADWLANENAGKDADSQIILTEDYNFPAIFKYFDFTGLDNSYKSTIYNGYSLLNMTYSNYQNSNTYRTTWMLTGNDVYDMSKFGDAFKGIGADAGSGHFVDDNTSKYMCLNADFDGNGNTIYVELEGENYVGLFPILNTENSNNSPTPFLIKNFTLEGSVTQTLEVNTNLGILCYAGGVAGYLRYGWYTFDGIKLQNFTVTNYGVSTSCGTAGIVARTLQSTTRFKNIVIGDETSDNPANVLITSPTGTTGSAGGLMCGSGRLLAENITMVNTTISTGGTVGGLSGYITTGNGESKVDKVSITDCTFESRNVDASVGAVTGYIQASNANNTIVAMHDVTVMDNNLIAPEGAYEVGRVVGAHIGTNYSKKEILKLYDKNSDDFMGPTTEAVWNCFVESQYEDCVYIYYNDFYDLVYAEELYEIDKGAVDESGNPLVRYEDCLETDLFSAPDSDNDGVTEPLDLITDTTERLDNTIIKWSSDSGTIEKVLNSVLDTLTNGTGLLNDGNNDNISVTVESLQVENGVISQRAAGEESLTITQRDGQFIISNNNKYDSIERDDSKTGAHIPGTFSLVHVTYSIGNGAYTETITIPIFVSNMVNVDIYSKVMIGEEYDVNVMRAIKRTAQDIQVTTKNSTYTIYTEFMYSSNRIDFDEELYMNKGFRLYDAPDPYVAVGTKLTLVDLTFEDDPKVYYYEVEKSDTFIPLAWFKDENGVNYQERNINLLDKNLNGLPLTRSYTTMYVNQRTYQKYNRGVEKYLLIVDCGAVEQVGNETSFSPIIMDGVQTGQDDILNKEVFYIKYRTYNTLSTYNGRTVEFVDNSVVTEGEINKDKQLSVEVSFTDTASDFYWSNIKPYDYINQNKYLEVVGYLKNENGEKIMLPTGTRIKCNNSDAIYEGIKNTSAIFYYKDVADAGSYAMLDQTKNATTTISFSLDFTYAKMEKLPSGNYTVCFDLVRNFNPQYPMGDDILDTIESEVIVVTASAEYGFRLDVLDKESLAFNIADVAWGTDSVVDFDVLMNSTLSTALAQNKQIEIEFTLYKKDESSGLYIPYKNTMGNADVDVSLMISGVGGTVSENLNENNLLYSFTGIAGADSDPTSLEATLTLPYEADINNYKLQAEMYVDGDRRASDFFIVNISNIAH